MKWPWQRQERPSPEAAELEQSLQETKILIAQAYAGFNSAVDPDLVESYVYEIQSLQARYSYLLRRRKALDLPAAPEGKGSPGAVKTQEKPVRLSSALPTA